jgi:cysteine sulfinate desulfinase/cysteine desulfurase-like protein
MIPEFAMRDRHCYMDNAATTVMDQAVVEAMIPYLEERYGNPETAWPSTDKDSLENRLVSQNPNRIRNSLRP